MLEKLCAKWFKATNPTIHNEARAIKMSYLACVLREMGKVHVDKEDNGAAFVKVTEESRRRTRIYAHTQCTHSSILTNAYQKKILAPFRD